MGAPSSVCVTIGKPVAAGWAGTGTAKAAKAEPMTSLINGFTLSLADMPVPLSSIAPGRGWSRALTAKQARVNPTIFPSLKCHQCVILVAANCHRAPLEARQPQRGSDQHDS